MLKDKNKKIIQYTIMSICIAFTLTIFTLSMIKLFSIINTDDIDLSSKLFRILICCTVSVLLFSIIITLKTQFNLDSRGMVSPFLFLFITLFFVIYPYFSLYNIIALKIIFDILLGFLFAALSLSIFFAFNNENGKANSNKIYVTIFVLLSSISFCFIFELLSHWFGAVFNETLTKDFDKFFLHVCIKIGGSFITTILFLISLSLNKVFCNYCLIYRGAEKINKKKK